VIAGAGCYGWAMRTAGCLVAVTLSLLSLHARADTAKAWSAAKAGLPGDAKVVFAIDFAALQKTQVFAALWPKMLEKLDATKVMDALKADCKIDPLSSVQGAVIAMSDGQREGAAYVALAPGLDRARLSSCLQREMEKNGDKDARVVIKQDGNITQVTDGKDSMFLGWVSKEVVVVPLNTRDRATMVKWMTGKGAFGKTSVGKTLARVNTSAALWGAGEGTDEFQPGVTVKGGYGSVLFARGNVDANLHAQAENAAQAKAMAESTQKQLDGARSNPLLPSSIAGMLNAVIIATVNDEVVIKASVVEKDLLGALTLALGTL
jgi:hypothetical protein